MGALRITTTICRRDVEYSGLKTKPLQFLGVPPPPPPHSQSRQGPPTAGPPPSQVAGGTSKNPKP